MDSKKRAEIWREEPIIPTGWSDWWDRVNLEEEKQVRRNLKVQQAGVAKKRYKERVIPNLVLVGWRGWWSRMEAEGKKEQKEWRRKEAIQEAQSAKEKMIPIETYFRKLRSKLEPSGVVNHTEKFLSSENSSSPKRKQPSTLSSLPSVEPSPSKKRKLNFRENLSFWLKMEGVGDTHSQHGPANIAVRKICESKMNKQPKTEDDLEVVIWRDNSESENGLLSGGSQEDYKSSAKWGVVSK